MVDSESNAQTTGASDEAVDKLMFPAAGAASSEVPCPTDEPVDELEDDEDYEDDEDDEYLDEVIAKALKKLPKSAKRKYKKCVFELGSLFFTIGDDSVSVMSSSAGGGCFGGCFPTIFSGPTNKECKFISKLISELDFKFNLVAELAYSSSDTDDKIGQRAEEYHSAEDYAKYLQIERRVKRKNSPFQSMYQFISAYSRYGLGDKLYYVWEGCIIDLLDNVSDSFDSLDDFDYDADDWKDIIENLDDYIVTPNNNYICEVQH